MTKILNLRFEEVFKISTTSLRVNRGHPDIKRDWVWKLQFAIIITTCLVSFNCLLYSICYHDVKYGKYADASKNGAMAIVFVTITLKYYMLLKHQKFIQNMIQYIERDYSNDNDYSDEDKDTVEEYAQKGVNVCKFWLYAGFGTCAIFPLKAFASMAYLYFKGEFKLVAMFEITFPEPIESYKNLPAVFWIWFTMTMIFDVYASTMNVGFDPIIPICMLHVCGQTAILTRRLNLIFSELDDPKEMQAKLRVIIIKVQSLYGFIGQIKASFGFLFETNMKATTIVLPFIAFQILTDLRNHSVNVEFVVFFWACVVHFFVPCYYSDLLMEKSEAFRQGIYASGWENCPNTSVRRTILLMLIRARVPMGVRSVFYEMSLDTFAVMCRQGYGIFNLMNARWG